MLNDEHKERRTTAAAVPNYGDVFPNVLNVPHITGYTLRVLYEQIHSSEINLEPEYQRDVVWPESKQIAIIDSVFRNFYIPFPIFVVNLLEDGSKTKTCVDGKQRLTSIYRFMNGLIPYKNSITGEELWYTDVTPDGSKASPARKLLPKEYRQLFANKQIACIEYQSITDSDEHEIFERAQLEMASTSTERLHAINTPRATFIRWLQGSFLTKDNGDVLGWKRTREEDFRCLAQAVYCIGNYGPRMTGLGTTAQVEKWLSQPEVLDTELMEKAESTFKIFAELMLHEKVNEVFGKPVRMAPVEFLMLAAAIGGMREVCDADMNMHNVLRAVKIFLDYIRDVEVVGMVGEKRQEKRKRDDTDDDEPATRKPKKTASPPLPACQASGPLSGPFTQAVAASQSAPNPAPAPEPTPMPRDSPIALTPASGPACDYMAMPSVTPLPSTRLPHLLPMRRHPAAGNLTDDPRIA